MITTSQAWKDSILNPDIARKCKCRATISLNTGFSDHSAVVTSTDARNPEKLPQLLNGIDTTPFPYIAFDSAWTLGTAPLQLTDDDKEIGFISTRVSSEQTGYFVPNPKITVTFNAAQKFDSLKIAFDPKRGEYAERFWFDFYDGSDNSLGYWTYDFNTQPTVNCTYDNATTKSTSGATVSNVYRIDLVISKWSAGGRAARVMELTGDKIEVVTGEDRIISLDLVAEDDSDSIAVGNVSSAKLTLTLDNEDGRYTSENPNSLFSGLKMENKAVYVEFGLQHDESVDPTEAVEWITGGTYYIDSLTAYNGRPDAVIVAYDIIHYLENYTVNMGEAASGQFSDALHMDTLLNAFLDVLPAQLALDWTYYDDLPLTYSNEMISTLAPDPVTCLEAARFIAQAGCSGIHQSRDGKIVFQELSSGDLSNMPILNYYQGAPSVTIPLDAWFLPMEDQTSIDTWCNRTKVFGVMPGTGASTYKGYQISASVDESGENVVEIKDNPIIKAGYIDGESLDTSIWYHDAYTILYKYVFNSVVKHVSYRCDPALEPGDLIRIELPYTYEDEGTTYRKVLKARVISHTIRYNGAFSGELTLRGMISDLAV